MRQKLISRTACGFLSVSVFMASGGFLNTAFSGEKDVRIVPHRAFYTLELGNVEERSGVQAVSGRMVIEITGSACDGWVVNVRFANAFTVQKGQSRVLDNADSYFESGDGKILRFSSRQYVNGNLEKETKGTAQLDIENGKSSGGRVDLKLPKPDSFKLPENTIFPLAHTARLLRLASKGERFDQVRIYDGDSERTVYFASSVIGPRKDKLSELSDAQKALADVAYWPVSASYYDTKTEAYAGGEQVPSHQVTFTLFSNGVSGDLSIDYGDFSLNGKLAKLEMLEEITCD